MNLIYHRLELKNQTSNFDKALLRVATAAPQLKLVSPYIGLSYLTRLTELSENWQLLTDVEAWLKAGNRKHRVNCWQFISANLDRIKHVADLHAKVAIGNNLLFLGSANFTNFGIQNRTELSVLIDESHIVEEADKWFQELWNTATPPIIEEGDILVSTLNKSQWTSTRSTLSLTSTAPKVQSALVQNSRPSKGLDIAVLVAQAGLDEAKSILPLTKTYEDIIQNFIINKQSFSFSELLERLKTKHSSISHRQVYMLLSKDTVNHLVGGFDTDGYDRFIFESNAFLPWNENGLFKIKRIDSILKFVIETLDFYTPNYLPTEKQWLEYGLVSHKIFPLIDQLINVGLLVEIDTPGDLEQYYLDSSFEWPRRWFKFMSAQTSFKNKLSESITRLRAAENKEDVDEDDESLNNIDNSNSQNIELIRYFIKQTLKNEIVKEASRQKLSPKSMGMKHDEILANHLTFLKTKKHLTSQELDEVITDLKLHKLPLSLIRQFRIKNNGVFTSTSAGKLGPSKSWESVNFLHYYTKSLAIWNSLTKY